MAGRFANLKIGSIELFSNHVRVEGGAAFKTPISNTSIPTLGGSVNQSVSLGAKGRDFALIFNIRATDFDSVLSVLNAAIAADTTVIVEITNIFPAFKVNAEPQTPAGQLYTIGGQSGGFLTDVRIPFKSVSFAA